MSLEASIDKLTAAMEAATGVLVALQSGGGVKPAATTPTEPAAARRGRPPKATTTPAASDGDGGLGGDEDGDGGLGDGGLGDAGSAEDVAVSADEAKAAVLAYRDKAVALKGKDPGLQATRALMKKFVANLDDINDENAAAIHKAFSAEITKLKK